MTERPRVWLCADAPDPRTFVTRLLGPVAHHADGRPYLPGGTPVSISHGRISHGRISDDLRISDDGRISDGHWVVAVAVGGSGPLGVDVERVRPLPALALAGRWLADGDAAWLAEQPEGVRETAFLWLWTQREAIGKARGLGLRRSGLRQPVHRPACWALDGLRPRPVPGDPGLAVAAAEVADGVVLALAWSAGAGVPELTFVAYNSPIEEAPATHRGVGT